MTQISDDKVRALLSRAGMNEDFHITKIPAGGNNRVYKLFFVNGDIFLLKEYFSDRGDVRSRLKTEFSFLSFLWDHGIFAIPKPYACSYEHNLGLFQFIEGGAVRCEDITFKMVEELLSFFSAINNIRTLSDAFLLPDASEACFSIHEHLNIIQKRIDKLSTIEVISDIDEMAFKFISGKLRPKWQRLSDQIRKEVGDVPYISERLPDKMKVLSPSDFGFHNALMKTDKTLAFIDFEYAGWDDPVKTICDLFCQPKIPLDLSFFDSVVTSIIHSAGGESNVLIPRIHLLFPAYQVKWCCILLNDFLPVGEKRRNFSNPEIKSGPRKEVQLEKAIRLFKTITEELKIL
jgi:hypothetical protein